MERIVALIAARRVRAAGEGVVALEVVHVGGAAGGLVVARGEAQVAMGASEVRRAAREAVEATVARCWPGARIERTVAGGAIGAWLVVQEVA